MKKPKTKANDDDDATEAKSLRIGVHHADAVVWEPVSPATTTKKRRKKPGAATTKRNKLGDENTKQWPPPPE
jgi:hypothetical protein